MSRYLPCTQVREDMRWIQDVLRQKESMSIELRIKQEGDRNSIIEKRKGLHSEDDKKQHAEC